MTDKSLESRLLSLEERVKKLETTPPPWLSLGGKAKTAVKAKASRENGKKGGRPRRTITGSL